MICSACNQVILVDEAPIMKAGLELDAARQQVTVLATGHRVHLSGRETSLLKLLFRSEGRVASFDWIHEALGRELSPDSLRVYVSHLRSKIGPRVRSVRGLGYELVA